MRRPLVRALAGIVLLALACGAALLSRGVAAAEQSFRAHQADWQRGLVAQPAQPPEALQQVAESLLGIRTRNAVLAAYLDYRHGLESIVEGAVFPQTQARWNAIATLSRLRGSLASAHDRAGVDVTLGVVYAASAEAAGPTALRQRLQTNAVNAFRRGVLEHPAATEAKLGLETLLTSAKVAADARARARNDRLSDQQGKPTTTPQSGRAGTGY